MNEELKDQSTKDGECRFEPAFPSEARPDIRGLLLHKGLTKREYFAGLAMQGMLASDNAEIVNHDKISEWAVYQADSLIRALNDQIDEKPSPPASMGSSPTNVCEPSGGEEI